MNKVVLQLILLMITTSCVLSCAPSVTYKTNWGDPASPEDGNLVFSLRKSTIVISPPVAGGKACDDKSAKDSKEITKATDVCRAPQQNPEGNKKAVPPKDALRTCLQDVDVKVVAARDTSSFYVAKPGKGTTLSATAVDSDPFMVKSVSVNYKSPVTAAVTAAGTGAVAGFAIGGPWGAVAGGLVNSLASIITTKEAPTPEWYSLLCEDDLLNTMPPVEDAKEWESLPVQLFLPVVLDYKPVKGNDFKECWRPLPNRYESPTEDLMHDQGTRPFVRLSGWFYRIKTDPSAQKSLLPPVLPSYIGDKKEDLPQPFQPREDYFLSSDSQSTFPVSACRSVVLEITWWEELKSWVNGSKAYVKRYPVMVADSNYVQVVHLPDKGTVSLLPVCGGYENSTSTSSVSTELVDEAIKQAKAVKEAQEKWKGKK
jgi:hypothetical protein